MVEEMSGTAAYRASVERGSKYWFVEVDGVGATQARHLRELDAMTRDLIGLKTGDDSSEVDYQINLPGDLQDRLDNAVRLRRQATETQAAATAAIADVARSLHKTYLVPMRDIGELLGVSYQRIHQLVQD